MRLSPSRHFVCPVAPDTTLRELTSTFHALSLSAFPLGHPHHFLLASRALTSNTTSCHRTSVRLIASIPAYLSSGLLFLILWRAMSFQYAATGRRRAGTIESGHLGPIAVHRTRPLSAVALKQRAEGSPSKAVERSPGTHEASLDRLPFNSRPQLPGEHFLVPATPASLSSHGPTGLPLAASPRPRTGGDNTLLLRERSATASRLIPTAIATTPPEQRSDLTPNGNSRIVKQLTSPSLNGSTMQTRHAEESAAWEARKRRTEDDPRFVS